METVINITHDTIVFGNFPADKIRLLSSDISVIVTEGPRFVEDVTITLQNREDEDMTAVVFTLGKLVGQIISSR